MTDATDDGFGSAVEPPGTDAAGRSTDVSVTVVLVSGLGVAAALGARVGPAVSVLLAVVDGVLFAASLWLVGRDRRRVAAAGAAGVLALFVGLGFALAVGYTGLALAGDLFPVADPGLVPPRGLRVASAMLSMAGVTLAIVGGVAAASDALRVETVENHAGLAVKTFAVPGFAALALLSLAALSGLGEAGGPDAAVADAVATVSRVLFVPPADRTHVLVASTLAAATLLAAARALAALPVAELTTARSDADPGRTVETAARWLRRAGYAATAGVVPGLVEHAWSRAEVAALVGDPAYGLLAAVTASRALRAALWALLLASLSVLAAVWLVRRASRASLVDVSVRLTPFAGGAVVVALVAAVHGPAVDAVLSFLAARLPGTLGPTFQRQAESVVDFFGSTAIAMSLAAVLVWLSALLSAVVAALGSVELLPRRATGPALAAVGLFAAGAFGSGAGLSPGFALAGVVASLVVWDAGEYGATLAREVGRAGTDRGTELVHVAATLAVGVGGATLALGLRAVTAGRTVGELSVVPLAAVGAVVGLVLLLVALR